MCLFNVKLASTIRSDGSTVIFNVILNSSNATCFIFYDSSRCIAIFELYRLTRSHCPFNSSTII
ncbi:hypothetical protein MGSAQ_002993 [marine sediment metagenome]|uniref:Uncharacterized protein n=1 Tax=marine sediment metagenome TaxID=412755 RepID=A0A1B6NQH5_9ZZZZ